MSTSQMLIGGVVVAGAMQVLVSVTVPDPTPKPLVDILSIEYIPETGGVRYERVVNSDVVVRAPFHGDVIEVATEREVPECVSDGRADYGPQEPVVQFWLLDDFFNEGCKAALVAGVEYQLWGSVSPTNGVPDDERSKPFIWGE